ncbi:sugar ABC transporter permease [Flavimobilis marinus]|uniref:Carbohydrate ABC transporter membrane protein 2, CUT1 family n=1 Tax=Flavimobilis marinus TaxID=285351 RepID=A0A1I2H3R8_9MICO|nr:sugar ABC transporter permease [Flavimobilis marinus]GHG54310.1 sugar ABC transporter permease [Flavimobilis marinus]SFF24322.1 carbohydrate ABC transporter membrane protein 2, CUT1 family [Flavimobilis marinus]
MSTPTRLVASSTVPPPRPLAAGQPTPRRRTPRRNGRGAIVKNLVALAVAVVAVFPILYVISASLHPHGTLVGSNSLFSQVDLANYIRLFNSPTQPYGAWFVNSLYIGIVSSAGTVLLGALAAYAFSRMRFTGRRVGLVSILLVQMFPQLLGVVAIFLMLMTLGDVFPAIGLDTHAGLILIYLGGAMGVNTYLIYGFFNTVPASIDEAAKLDGASHARIFFTIILPLSAPILAVVALLSFIGTSSEFVIASVVLTDPPKQTLAVGLFQFVSQETSANWSVFAAGAVLAAVPVVALFFALQKYIVGGLTAGAVK